jgi:hypothetical protein
LIPDISFTPCIVRSCPVQIGADGSDGFEQLTDRLVGASSQKHRAGNAHAKSRGLDHDAPNVSAIESGMQQVASLS